MSLYLSKTATITELDPPVTTNPNPKSVTVIVRSGVANVFLGPISGQSAVINAGETMNWSTLAAPDFLETMTISASGAGANVLVVWTYF